MSELKGIKKYIKKKLDFQGENIIYTGNINNEYFEYLRYYTLNEKEILTLESQQNFERTYRESHDFRNNDQLEIY